jgi:hypothetical protein
VPRTDHKHRGKKVPQKNSLGSGFQQAKAELHYVTLMKRNGGETGAALLLPSQRPLDVFNFLARPFDLQTRIDILRYA